MKLGGRIFGGYTVVEVMMFLAVSGGLFIVAMTFIGGRQNQAYFASSLREFQQQIEDVVNDVTTGYFPQAGFTCNYSPMPNYPTTATGISFTSTVTEQGTRDQCTFIGKVIFINMESKNDFTLIPVASGRLNTSSQPVTSFDEANPQPLGAEFVNNSPSGMTQKYSLKGGLEFTAIYATTPSETNPTAFGIFTNFGNDTPGTTPGSLIANTYSIPSSNYESQAERLIGATGTKIGNMGITGVSISKNISVIICLRQGAGGNKAALILGAKDRGLFSELAINDADAKVAEVGIGGVATCPA